MRKSRVKIWLLLSLFLFPACGEATFFVFWNTGGFGEFSGSGAVLVIGVPQAEEPESVSLITGTIPRGMRLRSDATIRGVPKETGTFLMTVEIIHQNGVREELAYEAEISSAH